MRLVPLTLGLLLLAACGTKGPLTLPQKPPTAALADASTKPADTR